MVSATWEESSDTTSSTGTITLTLLGITVESIVFNERDIEEIQIATIERVFALVIIVFIVLVVEGIKGGFSFFFIAT